MSSDINNFRRVLSVCSIISTRNKSEVINQIHGRMHFATRSKPIRTQNHGPDHATNKYLRSRKEAFSDPLEEKHQCLQRQHIHKKRGRIKIQSPRRRLKAMVATNRERMNRAISLHCTSTDVTNQNEMIDIPVSTIKKSHPQHHGNADSSLPGLILIRPDCGACPFCPDVCQQYDCSSCTSKSKMINEQHVCSSSSSPAPFRFFSDSSKSSKQEVFITPCQLKRHNTKDSAWLLCGDTVYDATNYIKGHPGGEKSILRKSGGASDCTKDMQFHSSRAINMWKKNKIGILKPCPGEHGFKDISDGNSESCIIS